jgi:hypothetical protein
LRKSMKYKVIDNFLEEKDFKAIEKIKLSKINSNNMRVFNNTISKDGTIMKNDCIEKKILQSLQKKYHAKALKILNELCPEKIKLYEFSEFHIIQTGANYKFPPHDDTPIKLLSGVIYVEPVENKGTMFFQDKKGNGKEEIRWKKNRAVFFSRKERETWHSYEGDRKSERIALVYNLMTSKIKEVCKIEKKSYLISLLRYKINPYLYRFFGFVI